MITSWHATRGIVPMGYHYFIPFSGKLERGRPLWKQGAHTFGHNHDSIGICFAGLHQSDFRLKQFETGIALIDLLRYTFPGITIHPHSEFNPKKTCPVFDLSNLLSKLPQVPDRAKL